MESCFWKNPSSDRSLCPHAEQVPPGAEDDASLRLTCLDCAAFWQDIHDINRQDGAGPVPKLASALLDAQERINQLSLQLQSKSRDVEFLHDVGIFLQGSLGRDEVIAMALTAVTAGKGYGLNRAILLLVDEEHNLLEGYLAVGPRKPEEAWRIWQEIADHDYSLKEMARHFLDEKMVTEREKFRDLLEALTVPLDRTDHLFVATLNGRRSLHLVDPWNLAGLDATQVGLLGARELALVPLVSGEHRIGLLLADNIVTGQPILDDDLHSLETFALPVSYAIERAALYERLRFELNRITAANRRLREQQELIVRMEKLALVGEMSADIAHYIRNPLAIIGGYTRQLLRQTPAEDVRREPLEAILREAGQIAEAVRHLLDYADARHPAFDEWDLGQAVAAVVDPRRDEMEQLGIVCCVSAPELEMRAAFDLKKVDYCLRALISRAIEAMPGGGVLEAEVTQSADGAQVRIADNGPGMSAEEIAAVFAPLFSGDGEDTGIRPDVELALCARMLQQQGGGLKIANRTEGGTDYIIVIPAKETDHGETSGG